MKEEPQRKIFPITEMDCPTCVLAIEKELKKVVGVKEARVNFLMKKVVVTYDPKKIGVPELEKRLEDLGYRIAYKKYGGVLDKVSRFFSGGGEVVSFRKVEDHDFEELVLRSNKPVVVMFSSPNCPVCKTLKPLLKEASKPFLGRVYVYEMDITATNKWVDYGVMSVPTLLYFSGGKEFARHLAFSTKEDIEQKISEVLKT